jgi:hypothetical protein
MSKYDLHETSRGIEPMKITLPAVVVEAAQEYEKHEGYGAPLDADAMSQWVASQFADYLEANGYPTRKHYDVVILQTIQRKHTIQVTGTGYRDAEKEALGHFSGAEGEIEVTSSTLSK